MAHKPSKDDPAWQKLAETVDPLSEEEKNRFIYTEEALVLPDEAGEEIYTESESIRIKTEDIGSKAPTPHPLAGLSHGTVDNIDKRTGQRFTKGRMPIEDRIDLHGMTRERAYLALERFIFSSRQTDMRCVLVITGKGVSGGGILKSEVPRWLNEPSFREHILSFSYAVQGDGGTGALYVLLKRRRRG